jgi:hypothetical protein
MSDIFCATSFETFALFEDSNLSQLGLPKDMIRAIHTKEEHYAKSYPQMGHTYKSRSAVPMPYRYYVPSPDIEISEPIKLRGRKSNRSPFQDKEVKSEYTDFAWYLQSIPFGEIRIFIVNKETNFFMFLYHKQRSKGAAGEQYAVMAWEPNRTTYEISKPTMTLKVLSSKFNLPIGFILKENPEIKTMAEAYVKSTKGKKKLGDFELNKGEKVVLPPRAIDYGYSELTTSGVDRGQLRDVHNTKGGNTNMKIQEFVRAMTRQGGKKYAPSLEKPLYVYNSPVTPEYEPRVTREARTKQKGEALAFDFLRVFSSRFAGLVGRANPQTVQKIVGEINKEYNSTNVEPEISQLAQALDVDPGKTQAWLAKSLKDFRKELFEEGRGRTEGAPSAYDKTSGFELEQDNIDMTNHGISGFGIRYQVTKKKFSPDEEGVDPETGFREAQPEKSKRELPVAGEYAAIPSIIAKHTLDGAISKFAAFLVTGKIRTPEVSIAGLLGIASGGSDDFKRSSKGKEEDSGSWLF